MWLVSHESKPRLSSAWTTHVAIYPDRPTADAAYRALLPGPEGSFGPVEYRNQTLAEVHERCEVCVVCGSEFSHTPTEADPRCVFCNAKRIAELEKRFLELPAADRDRVLDRIRKM